MITLRFSKADLWRHCNSWICSCLLCGLCNSVPVSFSQFYLSLDMSLVCDAPANILIINFRANEVFVIQIKFLDLFCKLTTLEFKLWLEFSVRYLLNNHLRIKNKLQYCNTVYCVFILFTVSARAHRNHVNRQNVFIYELIICLCYQ